MADPTTPDAGPDTAPPSLPPGWIAQWDAKSRKYYFVQISTGESTWEVPTTAAPQVPTPGGTPAQGNPYPTPMSEEGARGYGGPNDGPEGDRSLGGTLLNAYVGKNSNQSGLGGLASSFLGGSSSSGHGSSSQQSSGLGGLASSFLGGGSGSHGGQSQSNQHSSSGFGGMAGQFLGGGSSGGSNQQSSHNSGGGGFGQLGSMASSFLGGHGKMHGSGNNPYGYSSNGKTGTYTGTAPPASYKPSAAQQGGYSQHTPSHGSASGSGYGTPQAHQSSYGIPHQQQSEYSQQQSGGYGQQPHNPQHQSSYDPGYGSQQPPGGYGGQSHPPQAHDAPPLSQLQHNQQYQAYSPGVPQQHGGYGSQGGYESHSSGGYPGSGGYGAQQHYPPQNPGWQ